MKKLFILLLFLPVLLSAQVQPVPADLTYCVAPWGNDNNSGQDTAHSWRTWQKAFATAEPGDHVYFRGGTYLPTATSIGNSICRIAPRQGVGHTGVPGNRIYYFNYPGETPILDCKKVVAPAANPNGDGNRYLSALSLEDVHFLHFKGLTIRNVYQREENVRPQGISGIIISNMIFENLNVNTVGAEGIYLSNLLNYTGYVNGWDDETYGYTPYDTTRYINMDIYQCCDTLPANVGNHAGNLSDCFKQIFQDYSVETDIHGVIYFTGCRSWHCADDGFDLPGKAKKILDNCWSFSNQYEGFEDDYEGNAFKIGAINQAINSPSLIMTNCIGAYSSLGLFDLEYPSYFRNISRVYNNIFYKNKIGIQGSLNPAYPTSPSIFRNNIIYSCTGTDAGGREYKLAIGELYTESNNNWDYGEAGSLANWVPTDTVTVTDADFVSLPTSAANAITILGAARQADGSLPDITAFRLVGGSDLIGAGKAIPASDNGGATMSATPDIGIDWPYYDATYGAENEEPPETFTPTIYTNAVTKTAVSAVLGGNVTATGGATITARGVCWATTENPTTLNNIIPNLGQTGTWSNTLTGLSSNTTYYVRSYATNSVGTSYGSQVSFTTPKQSIANPSNSTWYIYQNKPAIVK